MSILLGIKNVRRNPTRLIIAVLLISIPMFLVLVVNVLSVGVAEDTATLKETVNNKLQIRAKGAMGHVNMKYNQDKLLPSSVPDEVKKVDHITRVESYLLAMSPFESNPDNFAIILGITPGDTKRLETHGEVGGPKIIAGRDLESSDATKNVGVIGRVYAREFNLDVENFKPTTIILDPSKTNEFIYPVNGQKREIEIVGIFETGYTFGGMQLFIPKDTFKNIYPPLDNGVSWIFVTVDNADNIPAVTSELKRLIGSSADIFSPKNTAQFISSAGSAITRISAIGTVVAGILALIVVFFVTLIAIRERKKEIGTLKAMGASNKDIIGQFLAESITFTLIGSGVAIVVFLLAGSVLAEPMLGKIIGIFGEAYEHSSSAISGLSLKALLILIIVSVIVAVLGSLYSVFKIIKLSPVEAMRNE